MTEFTAKTKAEAAKKIVKIKEEIITQASNFNAKKTIPLLLCLEDAIDNLSTEIHRKAPTANNHPLLDLAVNNLVVEWYQMIDEMIKIILKNGFYDETTKTELAGVNVGVSIGTELEQKQDIAVFLGSLRSQGDIGRNPAQFYEPRLFFAKIPGTCFFILSDRTSNQLKRLFPRVLKFRDLLYQKGLLETMVHEAPVGTTIKFSEELREIVYPKDFVVESFLDRRGFTPRAIAASASLWDWNSHFPEILSETIKSTPLGKNSGNINNLDKEFREICNSYMSLEGFSQTFAKAFDLKLETFFSAFSDLQMLSYYDEHTVGIWNVKDLLNNPNLCKKHGVDTVKKVVELLSDPSSNYWGLIKLRDLYLTDFKRLNRAFWQLMEKCFDKCYDNNSKGRAFECACRRMLKEKGLKVIEGSIDIFEPIVPSEVSITLWKKVKNRTDIDIVASLDNKVLVIECKENKWNLPSISEQNLFKKFLIEHFYRTQWISINLTKFQSYLGNKNWSSLQLKDGEPLYFIPLLVCNDIIESDEFIKTPLISYLELKEILANSWEIKTSNQGIEVITRAFNREITLPCFMGNATK